MIDDQAEPFLVNTLPMIDTLVLDEADRMIADGHFKELKFILNHIYSKRVEFKRESIRKNKLLKEKGENKTGEKVGMDVMRDQILHESSEILKENKNFKISHNLVLTDAKFDPSKIVDLDEEDNENFIEEIEE